MLNIDEQTLSQGETQLTQVFLFGNRNYIFNNSRFIINSTIEYLIPIERFKCSAFSENGFYLV